MLDAEQTVATRKPLVLIVDDDAGVRRLVSMTLAAEGYDAEDACNGEQALAFMDGAFPDLIVLDLEMPVMNGREFLQVMHERKLLIPVIVISAQRAIGARFLNGASDAIQKPFDPHLLVERARALLPSAQC